MSTPASRARSSAMGPAPIRPRTSTRAGTRHADARVVRRPDARRRTARASDGPCRRAPAARRQPGARGRRGREPRDPDRARHDRPLEMVTFFSGEDYGRYFFDGSFTGNAFADFLIGLPTNPLKQVTRLASRTITRTALARGG